MYPNFTESRAAAFADHGLKIRALTHIEAVILHTRYSDTYLALGKLTKGLHSKEPLKQAAELVAFALENSELLDDLVSYGSDHHSNRAVIQALSIDAKLLALGQILALTGLRLQAEQAQYLADLPNPSGGIN